MLFRQEVVNARRGRWLGTISLAQPTSIALMTGFAVTAALCVVLFLCLASYSRRSQVIGQLVPTQGMAAVLAPATGVLTKLDVIEGDIIHKGDPLGIVVIPRSTVDDGDAATAVQEHLHFRAEGVKDRYLALTQLYDAQARGLYAQQEISKREISQLKDEIETSRQQVRIAEETLLRLRQLQSERYVSELQVKQQEVAQLQAISRVQALERQVTGLERGIAQAFQSENEVRGQRLAAQAEHQVSLATLEQERVENKARGALAMNSPVEGLVAAQLAKPGQAVQGGQPILTLLPKDTPLEAELLVPSRAVGFIDPGDKVLLRYHAFPYQKFGHHEGRIARISRSALTTAELQALQASSSSNEPLYRVTVRLASQSITAYGRPEPLKPGMALEADVLGDRRRLIEWVLEPLYSMRGKSS